MKQRQECNLGPVDSRTEIFPGVHLHPRRLTDVDATLGTSTLIGLWFLLLRTNGSV